MDTMKSKMTALMEGKQCQSDSFSQMNQHLNTSRQGCNITVINNVCVYHQGSMVATPAATSVPLVIRPCVQPSIVQPAPVTIYTPRGNEEAQRRATDQYHQLGRESMMGNNSTCDLNNIKHSLKSGRDRTGVGDSRNVYVKWPLELATSAQMETGQVQQSIIPPVDFWFHHHNRGGDRP